MDRLPSVAEDVAAQPVADDPLWFKDAIVYELHVKAFFDANGDGVGDFRGLTEKLDYLQDLGVTTLWLLPFYPSPMKDDGYDVADYHNVAAAYGTRNDFRHFVREAHRRGLRVITELVVNHTSDQHAWFQSARRAPPGSAKREYYVWSDTDKRYAGTRVIFTDTETSNWTWDPVAKAYFWHRFFGHQPDLNFANPKVLRAVVRTMRFWLDMGVDGFRLDAIPYLCEREGTNNENLPETHAVIKQIRAALDQNYRNRVLLAEANQWPEDVREYFGNGDECHMAYHFPLMPRLFLAIAQEDRFPVVDIVRQTPDIPENCQWAIFLRNHDELTLEMVTDRERDYMYQMFATDPRMRVNVGIRRRLAPLMENDRQRIELMSFLLFTMPGTPILYYGDEIGMGDNIYLGDRNGVRTPMQWSPDRNAGFSRADPQRLYLPPIMDPMYGYEAVNVEAQARNPTSLLSWNRRMIDVRKRFKAFGRGSLTLLEPGNRKILAYLREHRDEKRGGHGEETLLCAANLSRYPQAVELDLSRFEGRVPVDVFGHGTFPPIGKLPYLLTFPGHGYYVFQLSADAKPPSWHETRLHEKPLPLLVMLDSGWRTFIAGVGDAQDIRRAMASQTRGRLEREVLLPHLQSRRWFAAKGRAVSRLDIVAEGEWQRPEGSWLLTFIRVELADGEAQTYFLPLAIAWEEDGREPVEQTGGFAMARVRRQARTGILYSAFGDDAFCRALVRSMAEGARIALGPGELRCSSTAVLPAIEDALHGDGIRRPNLDTSNTSVFFGKQAYLKGYRRLQPGINPEVEIGAFLTVASPYPNTSHVAGWIDYVEPNRPPVTLALLQDYVENQGNLWDYTLDYLARYLESPQAAVPEPPPGEAKPENLHAFFIARARRLGLRVGELHACFAKFSNDPLFDPEPATAGDLAAWRERVLADVAATAAAVAARADRLAPSVRDAAAGFVASRPALEELVTSLPLPAPGVLKTRYHGDLHLGQVLITKNDFVIVDFEGEPARGLEERRLKHSPLRDVAGLIRSADYAARTALGRFVAGRRDEAAATAAVLSDWRQSVTQAFLAAYREATPGVGSVPAEPDALEALIRLFVIEKALYEVRYELDNRPDWLGVPLAGLGELVPARAAPPA